MEELERRCKELESIYHTMQDELRPVLALVPNDDWEILHDMVAEWVKLSHRNVLPHRMHQAVAYYFAQGAKNADKRPPISDGQEVLARLMAKEIKFLIEKGETDHAIALAFGTEGHWLDRAFLNTLRFGKYS